MWKNILKYRLSTPITPEHQYLAILSKTLRSGEKQRGRNGNTYSLLGQSMRFSLQDGTIPLLTTKQVAWKTCLKELLWFIRGETDNNILKKQNVHIWNDNASKTFLSSRNLLYSKEGDLGPIYGHQWRHFNAPYVDCEKDYTGKGVDQLQMVIDGLQKDKYSRRLVMSAWNPCQLDEMALPPCHILSQFSVNQKNELSCLVYQRSGDLGLGIPFNIASYSFLLCILAKHCDLKRGHLIHFIGNAHIYEEHKEALQQQITRKPYSFPACIIQKKYKTIEEYKISDCIIENYKCHPPLHMKMIV